MRLCAVVQVSSCTQQLRVCGTKLEECGARTAATAEATQQLEKRLGESVHRQTEDHRSLNVQTAKVDPGSESSPCSAPFFLTMTLRLQLRKSGLRCSWSRPRSNFGQRLPEQNKLRQLPASNAFCIFARRHACVGCRHRSASVSRK